MSLSSQSSICAITRALRAFGREDAVGGVAAIEFAIIAPVLILLLVFAIDVGIGFYRKMQVQNAAQAGAQYASMNGFDATLVSNAVLGATAFTSIAASPPPSQFCGCPSNTGITTTTCHTTCPNGSTAGSYVRVSATGSYSTLFSYPGIPKTFNFLGQATVRLQ